jgi:hypothetical protein
MDSGTDGNSVKAIGFELGDVGCANSVRLDSVNVHDEEL